MGNRPPAFNVLIADHNKRFGIPAKDRSTNPTTWDEFVRSVNEAARKRPRRGGNPASLPPHDPTRLWPIRQERRCKFIRHTGKQCGSWAMVGGDRCHKHGGYRQTPHNPATIALVHKGEIARADEKRRAAGELSNGTWDRGLMEAAKRAIRERTGQRRIPPEVLLTGLKAMVHEDGGIAWRRFLASQQPIATREPEPNTAQRGENL